MAEENKDGVVVEPVVEIDPIAEKDAKIAKLESDLGNYKNIALKRLGKLPGDADFLEGADPKTGLTVEEQVKKTLLEKEIKIVLDEKDKTIKDVLKENSELKLALKNRPEKSIGGGDGGQGLEVKDNVLTDNQIADLTARAVRLKVDPQKFIENYKKNLLARR